MKENGKVAVYAGSYLHEKGAVAEQKRLAGKGVNLSIKTANVMIQISKLTAGSYSSSEDARKEADRLKKQGIIVRVIETGKK
jgi:cell division protein FtsN